MNKKVLAFKIKTYSIITAVVDNKINVKGQIPLSCLLAVCIWLARLIQQIFFVMSFGCHVCGRFYSFSLSPLKYIHGDLLYLLLIE